MSAQSQSYYLELTLVPGADKACLEVLMRRLHGALRRLDCHEVGVSFPRMTSRALGRVLRVHGSLEALEALEETGWLQIPDARAVGMRGPLPVPPGAGWVQVRRVQPQAGRGRVERERRRLMRRQGVDEQEAARRVPMREQPLTLPSLRMSGAHHGKQGFRLFVLQSLADGPGPANGFNTYGLSACSAVPWFE